MKEDLELIINTCSAMVLISFTFFLIAIIITMVNYGFNFEWSFINGFKIKQ